MKIRSSVKKLRATSTRMVVTDHRDQRQIRRIEDAPPQKKRTPTASN